MSYKPKQPFNVPCQLLTSTTTKVNGVTKKTYTAGIDFFASVKSYGGTDTVINDKYVIEDTLVIETWFHPDIVSSSQVQLLDDDSIWEVMNTPENIDRTNKFLKFKVKRVKGGA